MMPKPTVVMIEDEKTICDFVKTALTNSGYKVLTAYNGKEGLSLVSSICPDLILLDLGLPDIDGIDIIRKIREWSKLPILVISARSQEFDKVEALDCGADDYLTKPFGTSELMARIRAALRHGQTMSSSDYPIKMYHVKDLIIDFQKRLVKLGDREVHLTQIEYKLVSLLALNAGRVLTYDHIINHIWGPYADSDNQILRVNMAHIRRKLEINPAEPYYIATEIGVGYRMRES